MTDSEIDQHAQELAILIQSAYPKSYEEFKEMADGFMDSLGLSDNDEDFATVLIITLKAADVLIGLWDEVTHH